MDDDEEVDSSSLGLSAFEIDVRKRESSWLQWHRRSQHLIYTSLMRGGGEPFGAPFEAGVLSLTERIARRLHQRGFFNFETMERQQRRLRNRFTRYGAAPFRGSYPLKRLLGDSHSLINRVIAEMLRSRNFLFSWIQQNK